MVQKYNKFIFMEHDFAYDFQKSAVFQNSKTKLNIAVLDE